MAIDSSRRHGVTPLMYGLQTITLKRNLLMHNSNSDCGLPSSQKKKKKKRDPQFLMKEGKQMNLRLFEDIQAHRPCI